MRVLFATAEASPLAKVGGLADVAAGLPAALRGLGLDVRIILPRYANIQPEEHGLRRLSLEFDVQGEKGARLRCGLWEGNLGPTPVYLVEEQHFLARDQVYGAADDPARFTVFCRAVLAAAEALGFRPDLVHANDWHTAILPAWLKRQRGGDSFFGDTTGVLTIHNLAFQGSFDEAFRRDWELVTPDVVARTESGVSLWSTMALGISTADLVTTVSPTYAKEILTPQLGEGLDPLLRARQDRLFGVLNGIDVNTFDPCTDPAISPNYGPDSLERKAEVKAALQREVGLPKQPETPVIGVVSRLSEQKGIDLAVLAIEGLLAEQQFQLVLLGVGDAYLQGLLLELARQHSERVAVDLKFDAVPAQRIYAGSDLFLMPSRFEPCGLGQLIALRYGTVPVVRATGGLRDTIEDWRPRSGKGNGFVFEPYTAEALAQALERALATFKNPSSWRQLQLNGMHTDVSWDRAAKRYVELYELARRT